MNDKTRGIEAGRLAISRRSLLRGALAAAAAPYVITSFSLAGTDRPAPSNRRTVGCVGVGGRGSGDMRGFLSHEEVQVVAVCDVVESKRLAAKSTVEGHYGSQGCAAVNDFREVVARPDLDIVMIGTPDHWHALISIEAMKNGKDVFCEKPETLTIREGRAMVETARRLGRVFSGGSQRVWEDYNYLHKMVRAGEIGDLKELWVNCGGPSNLCNLPEEPIPPGVDWDLWLGPAPGAPYNRGRLNFRPWRDYSGGGMTDWGAHGFGGALFCAQLQYTGPVAVYPPDGKEHERLTVEFANGIRMYHTGGWGGVLSVRGTKGELPDRGMGGKAMKSAPAPNIQIPNYRGRGGLIGDFLYCVKTRERPFRNIEAAHRTVTVCHLGNIAYWIGRPIKWDPVKEEIIGDAEAARWLDRPKRAPWRI
ncbi:MAG: Gfo/Idh/MocA family oxidoreductase [Planctomycetes bacterium]|nr:Gfo/Idh/MocA family oxidoreductase [Planctomycetota bacterium]